MHAPSPHPLMDPRSPLPSVQPVQPTAVGRASAAPPPCWIHRPPPPCAWISLAAASSHQISPVARRNHPAMGAPLQGPCELCHRGCCSGLHEIRWRRGRSPRATPKEEGPGPHTTKEEEEGASPRACAASGPDGERRESRERG